MEALESTKFQWYNGNIKDTKPRGLLSLKSFIFSHQKPKEKISVAFRKIEEAAKNGDKKLKAELKQTMLYYFTPSVIFNNTGTIKESSNGKYKSYRNYKNIESFTGIAQIDVDQLEPEEAIDLKSSLFANYKQFYCVYLSPSRRGVKGIIRIPIVSSIKEFKEYYKGIEDEMDWIAGFDNSPKNLALPLFISHDEDILYREKATIWNKKGTLQEESLNNLSSEKPKLKSIIPGDENVYKSNAYYQKITLDIFSNKINAIGESGHPQLRSACLVLGSRCGAGYLSAGEAMTQAEYLIKSNQYLQKGISGYIATAKWAINQGYGKPKYYQ